MSWHTEFLKNLLHVFYNSLIFCLFVFCLLQGGLKSFPFDRANEQTCSLRLLVFCCAHPHQYETYKLKWQFGICVMGEDIEQGSRHLQNEHWPSTMLACTGGNAISKMYSSASIGLWWDKESTGNKQVLQQLYRSEKTRGSACVIHAAHWKIYRKSLNAR